MTKPVKIEDVALLRAVVGYLGEKEQFNWWPCSFFGPGSSAFLTPVFGRTATLAQFTAVANAAARVHDEYLGIGNTYHLFRLPEDMEQDIHAFWANAENKQALTALVTSRETALAYLHRAGNPAQPEVGPTRIGDTAAMRTIGAWKTAAVLYAAAFAQEVRSYPYFADLAS